MLDATRLGPKLYQGSYPLTGVRRYGFDVLVLCAHELQHRPEEPGVLTLRCPLTDDGTLSRAQFGRALMTAQRVAQLVASGRRTLVTCAAGRNRSGLVSALVLYQRTSMDPEQIVEHIQRRRPNALTNDAFVAALYALPPNPRQRRYPFGSPPKRPSPVYQGLRFDRSY